MTWISSVSSIILVGAKPVLVDVNIEDGTIDLDKIKRKFQKNKSYCCRFIWASTNLIKLKKLLIKNKILLINDDKSFGSKINGKFCHSYTAVSCTSFFPAKC